MTLKRLLLAAAFAAPLTLPGMASAQGTLRIGMELKIPQ
jgi:hypothetical protein